MRFLEFVLVKVEADRSSDAEYKIAPRSLEAVRKPRAFLSRFLATRVHIPSAPSVIRNLARFKKWAALSYHDSRHFPVEYLNLRKSHQLHAFITSVKGFHVYMSSRMTLLRR